MVLALVGAPSAFTWEAYKATKALGGALGAVLGAADAAAVAGIVGSAAAVVGAGLGGFLIGQAILNQLQPETSMPDMGEYYEVGAQTGLVRIRYEYKVNGQVIFDNALSQFLISPVKGMFYDATNNASTWYVRDGQGNRQNIISTAGQTSGTEFRVIQFELSSGTPVTPTKRLPSYVPTRPGTPTPQPPTPITVPGIPTVPVNPIAVPNPGNDEPEEGAERQPGVVVQVPEAGLQIRYTPAGVFLTNYNAPNKEPFRVPPPIIPPGGKAATPECCPQEPPEPPEVDLEEIICRLKALQDKVLDDGTDRVSGQTVAARSGFYEALDGDFFKVKMQMTKRPSNAKIQPSNAPAMDVYYCGWFSWVENGFPCERQYIHFDNQSYIAPPGVTGFMYQYYEGFEGTGQWQRRIKREYVDFCVPADAS